MPTQAFDRARYGRDGQGQHLDRHGEGRTEALHQLPGINNNDEQVGVGVDDFFLGVGRAAPFDQRQVRVHLIGAVDGDVDAGNVVHCGEGNAVASGQASGVEGRGNALNVREVSRPQALAEMRNGERRGGAGAESHHAAGGHTRRGSPSDGAFQQLLGVRVAVVHGCFPLPQGRLPSAFRRL